MSFQETLAAEVHLLHAVRIAACRVERGGDAYPEATLPSQVLKKADQAVPTGDDRDAGHVGILDLDEGGRARRQREVNDQACAFLAGRTLRSVELSLQARWQVHGMRLWRKALKPAGARRLISAEVLLR